MEKKKRLTKKEKLISKIREIIKEWGSFTTGDVQADSSPVYNMMGKDHCALIENFNDDDVDYTIYVHEMVTGEGSVEYEKLDTDTLEEILSLAEDWKISNDKTMDKCRDNNY